MLNETNYQLWQNKSTMLITMSKNQQTLTNDSTDYSIIYQNANSDFRLNILNKIFKKISLK